MKLALRLVVVAVILIVAIAGALYWIARSLQ